MDGSDTITDLSNITGNHTNITHVYTEMVVAQWIWIIMSPILIITGTIGNILAIAVLIRPRLRNHSTMLYLLVLAFADIFVLYTGLLRYWIREQYGHDYRVHSLISCRIHSFLTYFSLDFSVWLLVAVTVERFLMVKFPLKARTLCTRKHATVVIAGIFIMLVGINQHFFWMQELYTQSGMNICFPKTHDVHIYFMNIVFPWIDFAIYSAIPLIFMIICNTLIIWNLVSRERRLKQSITADQTTNCVEQCLPLPKSTKLANVTRMLLVVTCMFVVTTLPIDIYLIIIPYLTADMDSQSHDYAMVKLGWAIVNMLQYLNNAIHFILYCLSSSSVRKELATLVPQKRMVKASFRRLIKTKPTEPNPKAANNLLLVDNNLRKDLLTVSNYKYLDGSPESSVTTNLDLTTSAQRSSRSTTPA